MPVIFNEPLSFLQRLAEYMEHTKLIHQANAATDSVERMKVPPAQGHAWKQIAFFAFSYFCVVVKSHGW